MTSPSMPLPPSAPCFSPAFRPPTAPSPPPPKNVPLSPSPPSPAPFMPSPSKPPSTPTSSSLPPLSTCTPSAPSSLTPTSSSTEMPQRNVVSWKALIFGHAQAGLNAGALNLFKAALAEPDIDPNDFTYYCVVRVCSTATLLDLGCQVHARCVKSSFDTSPFVGSSLVSLYSKCSLVDHAYQVFDEMPERNLGAWNAILIAFARHGHTRAAFDRRNCCLG